MLIIKYTPDWATNFGLIKLELENALTNLNYSIEHVGSTAVPNLDAKPIIDIDIVFYNNTDFEAIKKRLENVGYYHNGDQGIQGREVFKRDAAVSHKILDTIRHHLYVCISGCNALERHILTRDFLRKNEWARIKYQKLKYSLAEKAAQDQKQYASLKELYVNDFIDSII